MKQSSSCLWFAGANTPDSLVEEFNENYSFPIQDLACQSDHSQLDHASELLGIPWEPSKHQPFASTTIYIGFT
jgi:hypothetical protein